MTLQNYMAGPFDSAHDLKQGFGPFKRTEVSAEELLLTNMIHIV